MDETSNTWSDNMNVTWQLSDVAIWLYAKTSYLTLYRTIPYDIKIAARFYKVQYEDVK